MSDYYDDRENIDLDGWEEAMEGWGDHDDLDWEESEYNLMVWERENDRPATPSEAMREYTWNVGRDRPDRAWICTPYDTWEPNPFYTGDPVAHPEDRDFNDPDAQQPVAGHHNGFDDFDTKVQVEELNDDDLPF
jgi:hypothetical protein